MKFIQHPNKRSRSSWHLTPIQRPTYIYITLDERRKQYRVSPPMLGFKSISFFVTYSGVSITRTWDKEFEICSSYGNTIGTFLSIT